MCRRMETIEIVKSVIKEALFGEIRKGFFDIIECGCERHILVDLDKVLAEAINNIEYSKNWNAQLTKETRRNVIEYINSLEFNDFDEFLDFIELKEEDLLGDYYGNSEKV